MTVRWVLAVMLVTTLVATHSHSPWSSLLRARNCRLPLGRALCLLLLGFPTLAKHGGRGGAREEGQGRREATNTQGSRKDRGSTGPQSAALPAPRTRSHRRYSAPAPSEQRRSQAAPLPRSPGAPEPRGTFFHVMTGKGSPAAAQGMSSSRPASCLYSQPGSTVKYGGS